MKAKGKKAKTYRLQLVVKLREEGHSQSKIAEMCGLSQSRVSGILKRYREQGQSGLVIKSPPGRPSGLNPTQLEVLQAILKAGALAWGFPTDSWTLSRIAQVIKAEFGLGYSLEHVRRLLKKLGFTRQRPRAKDYRQDEQSVTNWKSQTLPGLKKSKGRGL